jgi:uncharacterized protein YndB with AHSA1/START domain
MKRWMLVVLGVVIGLPLAAYGAGSFIPRNHVARLEIDLAAPPGRVWNLISDFQNTPSWRPDITRVRMDPVTAGAFRFTETSSEGDMPFEVVRQEPPNRQIVRIVDDNQPFGGTWTWRLEPQGAGTRLTISEDGFIKNPLFRLMGAFFFSPTDTIDRYLRDLAKALGEKAEPRAPQAP